MQSTFQSAIVFPGQQHQININAGDMTGWNGLNCASGISGTITVSISGPVSYIGPQQNTLTPTVSGLTFIYSIADFGQVNMTQDFGLLLLTDTTALAGDSICIDIQVDPVTNDNNLANNTYHFCYGVVNSYDPNDKTVYPNEVPPGYDNWLNYTIRFQNTGTAPAFNIRLEDTLSSLLDFSTFEVVGYKHTNNYNLTGDKLTVYFPNIMLADSASNEPESKGYFQYRIKPISGLQDGATIDNKVYIYFDYNAPIITNTATVSYVQPVIDLSVDEREIQFQVFPNPSKGAFFLKSDQLIDPNSVELYNMMGQNIPIRLTSNANLTEVKIVDLAKGLFILKVNTEHGTISKRIFSGIRSPICIQNKFFPSK